MITDVVLFFLSYKIQHKYIFKDDKKDEGKDEELLKAEQEKAKRLEAGDRRMRQRRRCSSIRRSMKAESAGEKQAAGISFLIEDH